MGDKEVNRRTQIMIDSFFKDAKTIAFLHYLLTNKKVAVKGLNTLGFKDIASSFLLFEVCDILLLQDDIYFLTEKGEKIILAWDTFVSTISSIERGAYG